MTRSEYYVLRSTGATVYSRPSGFDHSTYDAYTALSADPGKVLQHKLSGKKALEVVVLSDYVNLWEEVEDNYE